MRASATSRIASPAVSPFPQSKTDAGKADDASPFALLLGEVTAKPALQQKDAQNKDGANETADNAAGQANDTVTQNTLAAPSQAAATPVKPGRKAGNTDSKTDGNSADSTQAAPQQQAGVPAQQPGPQFSLILAANSQGAADDASIIPGTGASGQTKTQPGMKANAQGGQAGTGAKDIRATAPQAQTPNTSPNSVPPSAAQSPATGAAEPQAQNLAGQNSVPSNTDPSPAMQRSKPPAQTSAVQNTVQSNAAQRSASQSAGSQLQPAMAQNTVQPDAAQLPANPPVQAAAEPVKTGKSPSDDKSARKNDDKSDTANSPALQQAGTQPPVQSDPSQISGQISGTAAIAAAGSDDAGEDAPDAAAAIAAASGQIKAQAGQTAAPRAAEPATKSPPAQTPDANQTPVEPDGAAKPWQAKTANSATDGTADPKAQSSQADSAQANGTKPDDVKPAAPQQAMASNTMPVSKPADAGNGNLSIIGAAAPQAQQAQGGTAPAVTQNVQVSTPSANMPALAVEIAAKSQSGAKQFDIRLDPPELGRVEVRLSIDATGKASAHLSADQPQTLDLLQKDAPTLTRALRDAGLNVSDNGLNFSLRQQQSDAGASGNQRSGGNGRSFSLAATSSTDATSTSAAYRAAANGRLDIRV